MPARQLRPGDQLANAGEAAVTVQDTSIAWESLPVYNLHVAQTPSYTVGHAAVWVHNASKKDDCPDEDGNVAPTTRGGLVPTLKGNVPQADKWIRSGGRVVYHTDGGMTYIKNGISVRYNSMGYPDFTKYLYKGGDGLSQVRINLTGTRRGDFAAANAAAGFKSTPKGYTWHHHEDVGLMQLVETRVHGQFWHSGGFSLGQ